MENVRCASIALSSGGLRFYNYLVHVSLVATVNTYPLREQIEFVFVREDILSRMSHLRFQRCTCTINPKTFACVHMYSDQILARVVYGEWGNDVPFNYIFLNLTVCVVLIGCLFLFVTGSKRNVRGFGRASTV